MSLEQIKNIIDDNSQRMATSEKAFVPSAAKNCTPSAALIVTR
jgi:hypothetical protein